jgi:hypothetical protein
VAGPFVDCPTWPLAGHAGIGERTGMRFYGALICMLGGACTATPPPEPQRPPAVVTSPAPTVTVAPTPVPPPPRAPQGLLSLSSQAPLFAPEATKLEQAALLALEQLPNADVLDPSELAALDELAKQGKAKPNGPVCQLAPAVSDVFRAQYPEGQQVHLDLSCLGTDCQSRLLVYRKGEGPRVTSRISEHRTYFSSLQGPEPEVARIAKVDLPASLASWQESLTRAGLPFANFTAAKQPEVVRRGYGPLEVYSIDAFGAFPKPIKPSSFPRAKYAKCERDFGLALLEVDPAGKVGSCEGDPCVCSGSASLKLSQGESPRRLLLNVGPSAGGKAPKFGTLKAGTGSASGLMAVTRAPRGRISYSPPASPSNQIGSNFRRDLTRCLDVAQTEPREVPVTSTLGEDGKVEAVELGAHTFTPAEEACLKRELGQVIFTCPDRAGAKAVGSLSVTPPKEKVTKENAR